MMVNGRQLTDVSCFTAIHSERVCGWPTQKPGYRRFSHKSVSEILRDFCFVEAQHAKATTAGAAAIGKSNPAGPSTPRLGSGGCLKSVGAEKPVGGAVTLSPLPPIYNSFCCQSCVGQ